MSTQHYRAIVVAAVKHDRSRECRGGQCLCLVPKPRLTAAMRPCGIGADAPVATLGASATAVLVLARMIPSASRSLLLLTTGSNSMFTVLRTIGRLLCARRSKSLVCCLGMRQISGRAVIFAHQRYGQHAACQMARFRKASGGASLPSICVPDHEKRYRSTTRDPNQGGSWSVSAATQHELCVDQ